MLLLVDNSRLTIGGVIARAEKIRTAIPQANLNYLSIYVADAKGFFKDEGLENETVVISGPLSIAALLSGDVDYSGAGGSGMRAALKGAPLKGIYFQSEKVTFYLVADPSIKTAADLKGKKVAIGSAGDTQDRMITMFAERGGVTSKEMMRIAVGADTSTRILTIKSGNAQATTVDPGGLVFAQKEGLVSLGFLGDLFPMPFQGFVATEKKIRDNPAQIKRWLKGAMRGLMFVRDRPEEAVDLGMKKLQLGRATRAMVVEGTKNYVRALPQGVPGLADGGGHQEFSRIRHQDSAADQGRYPTGTLAASAIGRRSEKRTGSSTKENDKMTSETDLREQLATCTRIFAMQGMIGVFGHVSVYQPETKTVFITPGMGSDKGSLRPEDMVPTNLDGKPLAGKEGPPVEWPIHTALHGARTDALAVAHLHTPHATLFAIAKREFRPVTLQGAIFNDGVPLYPEAQLITNPERGNALLKVIRDKRAALLRGHGIVVVGLNLQEVLFSALVLEDDSKKYMQAAALGEVGTISPEDCRTFGGEIALERRAQRAWNYFCSLEKRWDRQPSTGRSELFP